MLLWCLLFYIRSSLIKYTVYFEQKNASRASKDEPQQPTLYYFSCRSPHQPNAAAQCLYASPPFHQPDPQPENGEHEQQVAAINEDIKKIKARIEVLKDKINEAQKDRGVQMVCA